MINLNLLSPDKKRFLQKKKMLNDIKSIIFYVLLVLIFSLIFLWGDNLLIKEQIKQTTEQIISAQKLADTVEGGMATDSALYGQKVKEVYDKLVAFQKSSPIIKELVSSVPSGIKFSYLSLDKNNKKIELRGLADTRDDLVSFKNAIEQNEAFSQINIPITSFLQKTNLDFKIDFVFNTEKIK